MKQIILLFSIFVSFPLKQIRNFNKTLSNPSSIIQIHFFFNPFNFQKTIITSIEYEELQNQFVVHRNATSNFTLDKYLPKMREEKFTPTTVYLQSGDIYPAFYEGKPKGFK